MVGLKADHTVHLVRGFAPATSTNNAGATTPGAPNTNQNASRDAAPNVGGAFGGSGPGASLFPGLNLNGLGSGGDFEQVQQQLNQNPNMMRDILNMPLVQNLMNNPEKLSATLIMNNPQMRGDHGS
nr:ubiquitin domain-containing protein DSK2b-like isoform X2 [Ipomoea batatas]